MDLIDNKYKVKKAVILAGGLGTRFLPATLTVAKELIPIGNKPILMYHLEDLIKAGITDILIVGSKLKEDSFKNFITPSDEYMQKIVADGKLPLLEEYYSIMNKVKITYLNQYDKVQEFDGKTFENPDYEMKGSSGAVLTAENWVAGEPFIVVNGDDLCVYLDGRSATQECLDIFAETGDAVEYAKELPREVIYRYSSIEFGEPVANEKGFKMLSIVEKPPKGTEPSNFMGFARYIFPADVFDRIRNSNPRPNGEYCITDVVAEYAREGKASTTVFTGIYRDCGSQDDCALAALQKCISDKVASGESTDALVSKINEIVTIFTKQQGIPEK